MATTKVAKMTPQTESRIVGAVDDVVSLINDGEEPNDAIVKIATQLQLAAPGHVSLLVHAYNTGRTNRQRESHSRLVEKAAEFPIADFGQIIDRLFPATVKAAAQIQREESVSADWSAPPTWLTRVNEQATFVKQAEAAPRLIEKDRVAAPYEGERNERVKRAYNASIRRDQEVEEARRLFSASQDNLIGCFQKLASWFGDLRNPTIADVRENVEALWGNHGAAILNHLEGTRPMLTKRAAFFTSPQAVDKTREPYRTIIDTIGQTEKVKQAQADYTRIASENAIKSAEELTPFVQPRRESPLGFSSEPSPLEKQAGPYSTALGVQLSRDMLGQIGSQLNGPNKDQLIDKQLRQISSPDHEQALRGIHTESMLHNMLATDPIISSYPPTHVTDAFNEVSQLAPHAAMQPAVMGPLLRRWLQQGNLDTFEGDQLVGTEHKLKQIHAPTPGKGLLQNGPAPGSLLAK